MIDRFVRINEVKQRFGISHTTFYRKVREGLMPPPIALGERLAAILETELEAIMKARAAGGTDDDVRALVAQLVAARKKAAA